jgi:chemotaxis protein methyltransferase CheR
VTSTTPDNLITPEEFKKFCEFFYRKTGILFDESKRYFVDKRVVERMTAIQSPDFRSYFMHLRFEDRGEEMQELVNAMTVNETYFFREDYQLQSLVRSILKEVVRDKKTNVLRLWSIPCSTGEEPYSLALYLLECWPLVNDYEIEIVASDIDTRVLASAQKGIYNSRSLQHLPPAYEILYPRGRRPLADL